MLAVATYLARLSINHHPPMKGIPSQVIAGCFALCAFAVAVFVGLFAGNDPGTVLGRALAAMFLCYLLGWIAGVVCQRTIDRHLESIDPDALLAEAPSREARGAALAELNSMNESDSEIIEV